MNICTTDLANTLKFYTEVLGFYHGPLIQDVTPGAYLYPDADHIEFKDAFIHILDIPNTTEEMKELLALKSFGKTENFNAIDHVSFIAKKSEKQNLISRLETNNIEHVVLEKDQFNQLFCIDPVNNLKIEVGFYA